jgi:hypothetical protein
VPNDSTIQQLAADSCQLVLRGHVAAAQLTNSPLQFPHKFPCAEQLAKPRLRVDRVVAEYVVSGGMVEVIEAGYRLSALLAGSHDQAEQRIEQSRVVTKPCGQRVTVGRS